MGWGGEESSGAGGGRRGACITDDDRKQIGLLPSPVGKGGRTEREEGRERAPEKEGEKRWRGKTSPTLPSPSFAAPTGVQNMDEGKDWSSFFWGRGRLAAGFAQECL